MYKQVEGDTQAISKTQRALDQVQNVQLTFLYYSDRRPKYMLNYTCVGRRWDEAETNYNRRNANRKAQFGGIWEPVLLQRCSL